MSTRANSNDVGQRLKELRIKNGLSLSDAGARSDISPSFLSLVETGKRDITFSRLVRLMKTYNADVGDLVAEEGPADADLIVVRNGDAQRVTSRGEGVEIRFLTRDERRLMMPIVEIFAPGGEIEEWVTHQGEEFAFVLEGTVEACLKGRAPVELREGDSVYLSAEHPHRYRNIGAGEARLLFVATPPSL